MGRAEGERAPARRYAIADAATLDSRVGSTPVEVPPPGGSAALDETLDRAATSTPSGGEVFHPGAWIGRYTILAKIGEGGMGAVFSAYDTELERRVAIKVLRPRASGDPLGHARMQREAQALARLSHPNVVQIHDVGWLGGQLFVAMEFVTGPTLRAWQREHDPRTSAGREAILAMYAQAGAGLAAAHARGLVHRDFKPDNVLVGDDGRARVLDFGLAAGTRVSAADEGEGGGASEGESGGGVRVRVAGLLDSDLTRTGSIMGTPAYMAPEQFLARRTDARADVFAFAAALYEALYAELPFAGETFAERQAEVIDGAVKPAPVGSAIPAWLRAVLLRGIERDPERRYPDIDALLAALADDPIARRRRRLRVAAALLVTTAVIVGVVIGGISLAQRWRAARAEAMAEERRLAVEARIDELLAAGAAAEAERAFQAYVTNPDNRGSAALARAWLSHGERARSREATDAALDAYASAYTVATASAEQIAAMVGLAELARDQLRWRGLVFAVEALEERFPEDLGRPEIRDLRLDAALARVDLEAAERILATADRGAGDDVRSVIAALRGAQHTPYTRCTNSAYRLRGRD
ncbi:MAG: protein kinase, partial [Myxococcales bacterium]|nr:protein kinase [Myxococcales bacterium]